MAYPSLDSLVALLSRSHGGSPQGRQDNGHYIVACRLYKTSQSSSLVNARGPNGSSVPSFVIAKAADALPRQACASAMRRLLRPTSVATSAFSAGNRLPRGNWGLDLEVMPAAPRMDSSNNLRSRRCSNGLEYDAIRPFHNSRYQRFPHDKPQKLL